MPGTHEGIGQLANLPIVLLPNRLETRFVSRPDDSLHLLVRIYPDDVHVDTHEPELTEDEVKWGRHFWEQTWRAGGNQAREKAAWAQLVERFGPERSAWIFHALEPRNPNERPDAPVEEDEPLSPSPIFPDPVEHDQAWTRAPHTRVLPDYWVAIGYRGNDRIFEERSNEIPDRLPTGPSPASESESDVGDILEVADDGMRWMIDFDEAVQKGMGIRIPLPPAVQEVDRLVVLGVKASLDGGAAAQRLEALIESHHYTHGLAFVPQGSFTNNTPEGRSGYNVSDPGCETSCQVECGEPLFQAGSGCNGDLTAKALGLETNAFVHLRHSDHTEHRDDRHMRTVLWPATWGYFLEQMMVPALTSDGADDPWIADKQKFRDYDRALRQARRHFIEYVHGCGPLPVLRIGNQPYGLLPITSLDRLVSAGDAESDEQIFEAPFLDILRSLREVWRESLSDVPHVGRTSDPDQDQSQILSMDATSSRYTVRDLLGREYLRNLLGGVPWQSTIHRFRSIRVINSATSAERRPACRSVDFGPHELKSRVTCMGKGWRSGLQGACGLKSTLHQRASPVVWLPLCTCPEGARLGEPLGLRPAAATPPSVRESRAG